MVEITVDGKKITVPHGINLIEAARLAGGFIPHYCYHSKLSVAGNCRMCLVEIEKVPKLQVACNTTVRDGMVFYTNNDRVKRAREQVLEFILVNHPLDCPVCDQAGECKLQEFYMQYGLRESRFRESKSHKPKVVDLGPRVVLDMERCILCTRCVRFCREIAKSDELCVSERGSRNKLTTYPGKALENAYSTNVVDICPVGALTSKDFRFKRRVWFLKKEKSICPGCARGCNIEIHHHDNKIFRLVPRTNEEVNQCWMCDEGRDTYKPVLAQNRLRSPMGFEAGQRTQFSSTEIMPRIQNALSGIAGIDGKSIVGIGSAQATNEDNYALKKFLEITFKSKNLLYHKNESDHPTHDNFLICADKNPNTNGIEALDFVKINTNKKFQAFFILGNLPEEAIKKIALEKKRVVIMLATHDDEDSKWPDFVIPTTTFAESTGTFMNIQRRVQKISPALISPGESRSAWEFFSDLSTYFGKENPIYHSAEAVFQDIVEEHLCYQGLTYKSLGETGKVCP